MIKRKLTNPTEAQSKYRNRLWAEDLNTNKKKATCKMRDDKGGRCCLQVAEDVAIKCGLPICRSDADSEFPSDDVAKFFGWAGRNPLLRVLDERNYADYLNDGDPEPCASFAGLTHKQIAECVLNTFVHPKKQIWKLNEQ